VLSNGEVSFPFRVFYQAGLTRWAHQCDQFAGPANFGCQPDGMIGKSCMQFYAFASDYDGTQILQGPEEVEVYVS
jgi:hypothetical protein